MKRYASALTALVVMTLIVVPAVAGKKVRIDFRNDTPGTDATSFSSLVGYWHIDRDGTRAVYAVDGRSWEQGLMSANAAEKAKTFYGADSGKFLEGITAYRYFPLSVCKTCNRFKSGTIEASFKAISGRIDQGAGIAFDIKPNGSYMVLRVNPLENNMVLFKMEGGRRSTIRWTSNVPTPSNKWQTVKVVVKGNEVEGYLNGKKWLNETLKEKIDGRVGLWSKADSYVFFDNFVVDGG